MARLGSAMDALAECSRDLARAREQLVQELREHSLVIGEVTLVSGARAAYYVDARRTLLRPRGFAAAGALLAAQGDGWGGTAVGGLARGGGPGGSGAPPGRAAEGVNRGHEGHPLRPWRRPLAGAANPVLPLD